MDVVLLPDDVDEDTVLGIKPLAHFNHLPPDTIDILHDEFLTFTNDNGDDPPRVWFQIPYVNNKAKTPPFGYKINDENINILDPIPHQLALLEEAKQYVKTYSYDTVARWLTAVSGRFIGYTELYRRIQANYKRQHRAATLRRWATRYKRGIAAAQKLEEQSLDAGQRLQYDEEGNIDYTGRPAFFHERTSQPRDHISGYDDGTPPEETKPKKKYGKKPSRSGPRRPARSRADKRDKLTDKQRYFSSKSRASE